MTQASVSRLWLRRAVPLLVPLSLIWAFVEIGQPLVREPPPSRPGWLVAACLCFVAAYLCTALGFRGLLAHGAGARPPYLSSAELYYRSLLARYLPGKVGVPAIRMAAAESFGVSHAFMASSVLLEAVSWIGTGTLLGLAAAWLSELPARLPVPVEPWLCVALGLPVAALLFSLATVPSSHLPQALRRRLRVVEPRFALIPWSLLTGNAAFWLASAAASVCAALALDVPHSALHDVAAAAVLSPVAGFLAVFVPAGLGVREAVFTILLSEQLGTGKALALSLMARAASLLAELLLWTITRSWWSLRSRAQASLAQRSSAVGKS